MSSRYAALAVAVFLSACGAPSGPPRDLNDACSIVSQRPNYLRAMKRTESKWNIPVPVQMAVIHQESKFDGTARTPYRYALGVIPLGRISSAYGYAQALDGTWDEYVEQQSRWFASRDDINDATDFMGWYMDLTERRNGISKRDARNQYLAYHEGHAGYRRGSYNQKAWLVRVANRVSSRAATYQRQLAACGKL